MLCARSLLWSVSYSEFVIRNSQWYYPNLFFSLQFLSCTSDRGNGSQANWIAFSFVFICIQLHRESECFAVKAFPFVLQVSQLSSTSPYWVNNRSDSLHLRNATQTLLNIYFVWYCAVLVQYLFKTISAVSKDGLLSFVFSGGDSRFTSKTHTKHKTATRKLDRSVFSMEICC